ncbi:polyprenyl synthetase family protein [Streptacidiphilus jiangxiensis]|uniref:Geranylgeranyl diphosphate synthase, type I n=1 Tax=Streptacidiphilus jiangxiensis TaxID=235985 RepID=A0A1H7KLW9_STRJI|nr:polyprenyl synthetase family protein [Streptacidiphilus jiangxiensis]SEK86947.1 geranylgeranyl diphosphate synthase, type I [Streptacidiphilus jiangxiensis]
MTTTVQPASPPASTRALAADLTGRARDLVEPYLRESVALLEPGLAAICGYHLGWTGPDGSPAVPAVPAGKAVRPAFALLAAEAVCGSVRHAAPAGAAVELIHNFSLIHDDIMDRDEERRRRPTVWKQFGVPAAILAGDALQTLAFDVLLRHGGRRGPQAAERLADSLRELVDGQARDLCFAERPWTGPEAVTVEEYRAMALGKTGSLLACASGLGALLGGGTALQAATLAEAAGQLGLAFQCVDDILGIWGDPALTGKPARGDLRERKRSLPVLAVLSGADAPARHLADLLTAEPGEAELLVAADLIEEQGGRALCEHEATTALARAHALLDRVAMPASTRAGYAALAAACVARTS